MEAGATPEPKEEVWPESSGHHSALATLMNAMLELNPYQTEPGPELDQLIHVRVMGETDPDFPAYSTDERAARRVLAKLKSDTGKTVVTGRTSLRRKRWFARYETNASDGTEVLAETLELAICRLALLRVVKEQ